MLKKSRNFWGVDKFSVKLVYSGGTKHEPLSGSPQSLKYLSGTPEDLKQLCQSVRVNNIWKRRE